MLKNSDDNYKLAFSCGTNRLGPLTRVEFNFSLLVLNIQSKSAVLILFTDERKLA